MRRCTVELVLLSFFWFLAVFSKQHIRMVLVKEGYRKKRCLRKSRLELQPVKWKGLLVVIQEYF